MTVKHIFLFSGPAGSGKDTCALYLKGIIRSFHPHCKVRQYSFAHALKEITADLTRLYLGVDLDVEKMTDWQYKEEPHPKYKIYTDDGTEALRIRRLLQVIGTDILRKQMGDDVFAQIVADRIRRECSSDEKEENIVLITDLRFPNELETIVRSFGKERTTCLAVQRGDVSIKTHISESYYSQMNPDIVIHNDGPLSELEERLLEVYHRLPIATHRQK